MSESVEGHGRAVVRMAAAALVASIIGLAHSLGLRIVAEGVETQVAYSELTRLGCDQAQATSCPDPSPPSSSTTGSATGA
jgi:EAL domain-containing protein (putative c-di-GMP-specific phosphodiesterase class I)